DTQIVSGRDSPRFSWNAILVQQSMGWTRPAPSCHRNANSPLSWRCLARRRFYLAGGAARSIRRRLGFPPADPLVGLCTTAAILFLVKDTGVTMWRRVMDAVARP